MTYVVKRGKEYWTSHQGEKSVYFVEKSDAGGYDIVREWWHINDSDDVPNRRDIVENRPTQRGAQQRMGRLLKPLTTAGRR